MKWFISLFTSLFFSGICAQSYKLLDVKKQYLGLKSLNMHVSKTFKNANKLKEEKFGFYLKMNRISTTDCDVLYWDTSAVCILKDKSTHQKIQYFNRFTDSMELFPITKDEIKDCNNQLRGLNLSSFENPFLGCFYHTMGLLDNVKLTDLGNAYFYEMKQNHYGFAKRIWINKKTLMVDSLYYGMDNVFWEKVKFEYFEKSTLRDIDYSKSYPLEFDSIVGVLTDKPIVRKLIDTAKLKETTSSFKTLTLLDFWFIGCMPCIKGFPKLQALRDSFGEDFLSIRAINSGDTKANIDYFKSRNSYTFNIEHDSLGLTQYYKIETFPTQLLIDKNGKVLLELHGNNSAEFNKLLLELRRLRGE